MYFVLREGRYALRTWDKPPTIETYLVHPFMKQFEEGSSSGVCASGSAQNLAQQDGRRASGDVQISFTGDLSSATSSRCFIRHFHLNNVHLGFDHMLCVLLFSDLSGSVLPGTHRTKTTLSRTRHYEAVTVRSTCPALPLVQIFNERCS